MLPASSYAHLTGDGTTVLVPTDGNGLLHRVVIGTKGSAGTLTLQGAGGGDVIAVIDLANLGAHEFGLAIRSPLGLEAVVASSAGGVDATVIYDG